MSPAEVVELGIAILEAAEKVREFVEKARADGLLSAEQVKRVADVLPRQGESGALVSALESRSPRQGAE